jgi:hypothetical protein
MATCGKWRGIRNGRSRRDEGRCGRCAGGATPAHLGSCLKNSRLPARPRWPSRGRWGVVFRASRPGVRNRTARSFVPKLANGVAGVRRPRVFRLQVRGNPHLTPRAPRHVPCPPAATSSSPSALPAWPLLAPTPGMPTVRRLRARAARWRRRRRAARVRPPRSRRWWWRRTSLACVRWLTTLAQWARWCRTNRWCCVPRSQGGSPRSAFATARRCSAAPC